MKEFTARHRVSPVWWFGSRFRFGVDDRFIRPGRQTKNYPLIGTAFWRDESFLAIWALTFGDPDGKPEKKKKKKKKKRKQKESDEKDDFDADEDLFADDGDLDEDNVPSTLVG